VHEEVDYKNRTGKECRVPVFGNKQFSYPMPMPYPVDVYGELLGGWDTGFSWPPQLPPTQRKYANLSDARIMLVRGSAVAD
jgi:hypothetical protein